MTLRAAIYARQSIGDEYGIVRQQELTGKLIAAKGWTLAGEYLDNDVSASKKRGKGTRWFALLQDAADGKIDVVVAVNMDRLLRNLTDLVVLTDSKLRVLTVTGDLDLMEPEDKFKATLMAALAEFEGKRKAERTKRANDQRNREGIPAARGRSFGWDDVTHVNESEAVWVRYAHEILLAGGTLHSITKHFNAEGVHPIRVTRSLDSDGEVVKTPKVWTATTVTHMLKRARNAGILMVHGERAPLSQIEPIVSEADHLAVLELLSNPARRTNAGRPPINGWLSGLMHCPCGRIMVSKNLSGHPGYVCEARNRSTAVGAHVAIRAEYAHGKVLMWLYGDYSAGWLNADKKVDPERLRKLDTEVRDLNRRRTGIQEDMESEGYDRAHGRKRLGELAADIALLEAERSRLVIAGAEARWLELLKHTKKDSSESAEAWLEWWNAIPLENRRALIKGHLKITVAPGRGGAERVRMV